MDSEIKARAASSHIWTDVPAALSMATVTRSPPTRSTIDTAAARLRPTVMVGKDGAFPGIGGLPHVRHGNNGGHFVAPPNAETIEKSVSAHLGTPNVEGEDFSALAPIPRRAALATRHRAQLAALPDPLGYSLVQSMEQSFRTKIFSLIERRSRELIFHIAMTFAGCRFPASYISEDSGIFFRTFVHARRNVGQIKIDALMDGDQEVGALCVRHTGKIWQNNIRSRTS